MVDQESMSPHTNHFKGLFNQLAEIGSPISDEGSVMTLTWLAISLDSQTSLKLQTITGLLLHRTEIKIPHCLICKIENPSKERESSRHR